MYCELCGDETPENQLIYYKQHEIACIGCAAEYQEEYGGDDWTLNRVCPKCGEPVEANWTWAFDDYDQHDYQAWYLTCEKCGCNYVDQNDYLVECE